jgi:hypothetical protein
MQGQRVKLACEKERLVRTREVEPEGAHAPQTAQPSGAARQACPRLPMCAPQHGRAASPATHPPAQCPSASRSPARAARQRRCCRDRQAQRWGPPLQRHSKRRWDETTVHAPTAVLLCSSPCRKAKARNRPLPRQLPGALRQVPAEGGQGTGQMLAQTSCSLDSTTVDLFAGSVAHRRTDRQHQRHQSHPAARCPAGAARTASLQQHNGPGA